MISSAVLDEMAFVLTNDSVTIKYHIPQATANCGYKDNSRPDWLIPMAKDKLPKPAKEMFPKKAKFQVTDPRSI